MGQYDNAMKRMVEGDPKAIVEFILQQAKIMGGVVIDVQMISDTQHMSTTFEGSDADADGLLLVTLADGRQFLVHIEFQVKPDLSMSDRLLDYCLRARRKHRLEERPPLPIISCVIYLRKVGKVPEPPLVWELFDGQKNLVFDYVSIKLYELSGEEILSLNQPGLLPLSLLTQRRISRKIVTEMFEELLSNNLNRLMPVGYTIATWVLKATDLRWLEREYNKMLDFFRDSPAYEWMTREGLEQGREEARQEKQRLLEASRQSIMKLIAGRYPKWTKLAKKQIRDVEDLPALVEALSSIALAKDAEEVGNILSDLDAS